MQKLFDVVAVEENAEFGVSGEILATDVVAIEDALVAIENADKAEELMVESEDMAKDILAQVAVEETILATPEQVTAGTANLAVSNTIAIAKQLGGHSSVAIESDVSNPVETMTVAVEEKRNFAKKIYDSVVILLKRLVNMAKKAFAKIVMTMNGNKGALEKAKKAVTKIPTFTFPKEDTEEVISPYEGYWMTDNPTIENVFAGLANLLAEPGSAALGTKTIDVKEDVYNYGTGIAVSTKRLKAVGEYITGKKDKFFGGDNLEGKFDVNIISLTGSYVRVVINSTDGNDQLFVKTKKISVKNDGSRSYADSLFSNILPISAVEKAIKANKDIKKFLDTASKTASKSLDNAQKLAKAADKADDADNDVKKVAIQVAKVEGTIAYGISMDRFKNIRDTIKLTNKIVDAHKSAEKDKKNN